VIFIETKCYTLGMIVVTGATGFIGQRLVALLVKEYKPNEIWCLVWRKNNPREIDGRRFLKKLGVGLIKIDLLDKDSLEGLPKNPKLVFHLAATTDTALPDHSCNNLGTENLVTALEMNEKTHFVYTGTCAMYCGRTSCQKPITEHSRPVTSNRYSRSKLRAELLLKQQANTRRFSLSILRPPTVYGADPRDNSLFDFMKKLINKRSVLARLNWPGLTSLVWVDDMAATLIWAAKHPAKPGKINTFVVSAESLTLTEISRLMHQKMGVPFRQINLPVWFWKLAAKTRRYIFMAEKLVPSAVYNLAWRASLVVNDVINVDASEIRRSYKDWKPVYLKDKLVEVISWNY